MAAEYRIDTIADFEKVPDDRICDCLEEFVSSLLQARIVRKKDSRIHFHGMVWIDDGITMTRCVNLRIGDTVEKIPNPNFPQAE